MKFLRNFRLTFLGIALTVIPSSFSGNIFAQDEEPGGILKTFDEDNDIGNSEEELSSSQEPVLRWKFNQGDILEIKKKSIQDVTISFPESDPMFQRPQNVKRDLFYRVTLENIGTDSAHGYLMDTRFHTFINYRQNKLDMLQEEENYSSSFYIHPRGIFHVPAGNYMPNVRDIPVFPEKEDPASKIDPMKPGYSWSYPGVEIMNVGGNLEYIPLNVKYEYRGLAKFRDIMESEKKLHMILYNTEFNHTFKKSTSPDNPRQIFGYVTSRLLWDESLGMPYLLTEDYDIVIIFNNGQTQEFKITSRSEYSKKVRKTPEEKEKIIKDIASSLEGLGTGLNFNVQSDSRGIAIQIPDILFDYNSFKLTGESEKILEKVSKIIEKYSKNNQFLIRGHTDKLGTEDYNMKLSSDRAATVASYLIENAGIPVESLSFEGVGSKFPVGDNQTENGRKKNRRVEILILDK